MSNLFWKGIYCYLKEVGDKYFMGIKVNWMKAAVHIVAIICIFFAGFVVARSTLHGDLELQINESASELTAEDMTQPHEPDEMWHRFGAMTFSDMRQSIMEYGAIAFEDATGIDIVFDNPDEILSIADPNVMARGFSSSRREFITVLFNYQHWRDGWRVVGYGMGDWWDTQPQVTRGIREGRRYVDADTVEVRFYSIVDWGGGQSYQPVYANIPGEIFAEEFVRLFRQHVGIQMLDMWFIGEGRLYVNLTQGSAARFATSASLYRTLFSIPSVEEIIVLVEGQPEQSSDHMVFAHISRRDDPHIQSMLELPR